MTNLRDLFDDFDEAELGKLWPVLAELPTTLSANQLFQAVDSKYRDVMNERMEREARLQNALNDVRGVLNSYVGEGQYFDLALTETSDYELVSDILTDMASDIVDELKSFLNE